MGEEPTTARAARIEVGQRSVRALANHLQGEHLPRRPDWDCLTCDPSTPWPCDPARVRLAEMYEEHDNRIGLSMYMGSLLHAALEEMPDTPANELHERFVAWTR
ncbi:hypothetical protein ACLQ25_09745 [Micromonospora sp. DT44]|uniref:hypothetical protein n=1 Tax=Micromonospora sp. DT44 TaxID=3393439 RepID=UPI003CEFF505